jgi:HK97 family phage major capsid protein
MTEEVKNYVEQMGRTFEEFKSTMETRLTEIESKGHADPLTETKLENIEGDLDKLEDFNQKLTLQEQEYKQINQKLDRFETMLKRPDAAVETATVDVAVKAFDHYLRKGENELSPEEKKSLTVGDNTAAGFLAPPEYVNELIKTVTEISPLRSIARVRPTTQKSVQMPSRTATFSAVFVAEQGTRSETTGYTTQQEEIPTHEMYALVDISEALLEDSVFNLEAEMQQEFATQFAKAEGEKFITGTGVGAPEGITTILSPAFIVPVSTLPTGTVPTPVMVYTS